MCFDLHFAEVWVTNDNETIFFMKWLCVVRQHHMTWTIVEQDLRRLVPSQGICYGISHVLPTYVYICGIVYINLGPRLFQSGEHCVYKATLSTTNPEQISTEEQVLIPRGNELFHGVEASRYMTYTSRVCFDIQGCSICCCQMTKLSF